MTVHASSAEPTGSLVRAIESILALLTAFYLNSRLIATSRSTLISGITKARLSTGVPKPVPDLNGSCNVGNWA